jgi:hypothetical protein
MADRCKARRQVQKLRREVLVNEQNLHDTQGAIGDRLDLQARAAIHGIR